MIKRPAYYRWSFSPLTSDVDLSHNRETKPSDVPTPGEMAARRPEKDIQVGYAYRIHGGWRVTTAEHRPIDDPGILHAVVRAISQAENFKAA